MSRARIPVEYLRKHRRRFVEELRQFVRIPSISAQPARANDVARAGAWLANQLRRSGLGDVQIVPTRRHPIVCAKSKQRGDRPTVLIYGHYDVQPVDPLAAWRVPPFEPTVRGRDLLGRGASDDKGQLLSHVKALEASLRTAGTLPVNVKCLFEGEEEIGSPNLAGYIRGNRAALAADVAVMSDTRMLSPRRPVLTIALRGAVRLEVSVCGPEKDLHSGQFGGTVLSGTQALIIILSKLHDGYARITAPGFYDSVRMWDERDRQRWRTQGPSAADVARDAGVAHLWGEPGFTPFERSTIRPALTISGLTGGYQGPGSKSVLPASATAKLDVRLAPDQDPHEAAAQLRERIRRLTPPATKCHVSLRYAAPPVVLDHRTPAMRAAALAYQRGFGAPPVLLPSGGTIPVVNLFRDLLGISTVLMGFALPDDRMHAPNEKFHLPNFFRGIVTSLVFLQAIRKCARGPAGVTSMREAAAR